MDRAYKANLNESTERVQAAGKGLAAAEAGLQEMDELQVTREGDSLLDLQLMALLLFLFLPELKAQIRVPIIEDGQAQVIPEFEDPEQWIRHDLWVETTFDTDGDGKPDRRHVAVTRPAQTESGDLKLPVIYETSPYYAGTARPPYDFFWYVDRKS